MKSPLDHNTLFYGDNLPILREYIPDDSIDLVYLDPPFNSNRTYNVLFKQETGQESEAQIAAFDDTWHWSGAAEPYHDLVRTGPPRVALLLGALHDFIGENQMMAYLVMMAARLVELHRVLKPTGSLYLHCDPTAGHYLKIVLDTIFGVQNFQNEIIWKRTSSHNDARRKYADVCDTILFYAKTNNFTFNVQYEPYSEKYLNQFYRYVDENGRRFRIDNLRSPNPRPNLTYDYKGYKPHPNGWAVSRERMEQLDREGRLYFPKSQDGRIQLKRFLDEMPGVPSDSLWDDIPPIHAHAAERLGYPTQKPLALLERIISASSNPGDVVLDPFCGCGTTIAAAQKLGRRWIGIDVTHLAIALQKYRLLTMFPDVVFQVIGEPTSVQGARQLADDDRFQFQWWALSLIRARPYGGEGAGKQGKKGADKGIDGLMTFIDDATGKPKRVIVQVKSGKVSSRDVRDLVGAVTRESAALGVFLTLEEPTAAMRTEALSAGFYESPGWNRRYPRVQLLTIAGLLGHTEQLQIPPAEYTTFKQAPAVKDDDAHRQGSLFD